MTPTLLLRLRRWWRAARRKASTVRGNCPSRGNAMKTFCYLCNRESSQSCDYCGKSVCLGHMYHFLGFEDFDQLRKFIEKAFIPPPSPPKGGNFESVHNLITFDSLFWSSTEGSPVLRDIRDALISPTLDSDRSPPRGTYRNFYEKVLAAVGGGGLKASYFCPNCKQIIDYFNKILLPVVQKARQSNDICCISTWCLYDAVTQCNRCRKYACGYHLRKCAVCRSVYCSENWWEGSKDYDRENYFSVPDKGSCAGRHKHWFGDYSGKWKGIK